MTEAERRGGGGWDEVVATEPHLVGPGAEWRSELYRVAADQFNRAADLLFAMARFADVSEPELFEGRG